MSLVLSTILLFAKDPRGGLAKTRLARVIGDEAAAALYEAFVGDLLDVVATLQQRRQAVGELHTDTPTDSWSACPFPRRQQAPGDLGAKMLHALNGALSAGHPQAIVLASDAPSLPQAHLEALLCRTEDVVFGPCDDGGYYAVACRRTHSAMFDAIEWSTDRALEQSIAAARRSGLTVGLGPAWFDVDEPADLVRLLAGGELRHRTARLVRQSAMIKVNPSVHY